MEYFLVRYASRVVNNERKMFIRLPQNRYTRFFSKTIYSNYKNGTQKVQKQIITYLERYTRLYLSAQFKGIYLGRYKSNAFYSASLNLMLLGLNVCINLVGTTLQWSVFKVEIISRKSVQGQTQKAIDLKKLLAGGSISKEWKMQQRQQRWLRYKILFQVDFRLKIFKLQEGLNSPV